MDIPDITDLKSYQEYKKAEDDFHENKKERQQRERTANKLWDASKAKRKEAELASSITEAEQLEAEASSLRKEARDRKQELDEWMDKQPHYANIIGEKRQELEADLQKLIPSMLKRARDEIDDAVDVLQAINDTKGKFSGNTFTWIKSVSHALSVLKEVKTRLK